MSDSSWTPTSKFNGTRELSYFLFGNEIVILRVELEDRINYYASVAGFMLATGFKEIEDAKMCAREFLVTTMNNYFKEIQSTSLLKTRVTDMENRGEDFHD